MTFAIQDARDEDMAIAPSIPIAASLMRARSSNPTDVATTPAATKIAPKN